jgi:hypothetical protein
LPIASCIDCISRYTYTHSDYREVPVKPPEGLGRGWEEIWKSVAAEALRAGTRQELAKKLHVSTRTLQRILVDGDVPDFSEPVSRKVLHSWTRIITRLAVHFGADPWEWLGGAGISRDEKLAGVVDGVLAEEPAPSLEPSAPILSDGGFVPGMIAPPEISDSISHHLMKALGESLPDSPVKRRRTLGEWLRGLVPGCRLTVPEDMPLRADGADLYNGVYCHSCLAPLSDEENRGASDLYCRFCSDDTGRLLPRPEVLEIMTEWFRHWQPSLSEEEARRRADLYMSAMPAWN